ncbi:hypothetical protein [Bifidobacterium sp. SO4]|uniref:hypothetical protein n=1 Tax=Bifidobacterium sp. SO4 TaxID=2809030 RepID=UPI001BDBEC48|nr:hypothetical protein [Bifidobacterium sp. SO4]MBT1170993.1 hypothetical protein [Bifidobacterium sp. SO4]
MSDYYCPYCGADIGNQFGFDPTGSTWKCASCRNLLYGDVYSGSIYPGTMWYCDSCRALLNRQTGFADYYDYWTCTQCGYSNHIASDEIYNSQEEYENSSQSSATDDLLYKVVSGLVRGAVQGIKESLSEANSESDEEGNGEDPCSATPTPPDASARSESVQEENAQHYLGVNAWQEAAVPRESRVSYFQRKAALFGLGKVTLQGNFDAFVGRNYREVLDIVSQSGFKQVTATPVNDLTVDRIAEAGRISQIMINGVPYSALGDTFSPNDYIDIVYHDIYQLSVPWSSEKLRNMGYYEVVGKLRSLGFMNITGVPIPDLITGWLKREGTVEEIIIDGISSFKKKQNFRYNSNIVITYHTFQR